MQDSFQRDITYLRLSVTDLCNLRCQYCMPEEGVEKRKREELLSFEEIDIIITELIDLGIRKVRITGGEPLVRKDLVKLIEKIREHKELEEITLTTNGILLEEMAEELKHAGVDRFNISLDTLDSKKYAMMTRGGELEKVLQGIKKVIALKMFPIKLNVVLIQGFNDNEVEKFVQFTEKYPVDVRFIELMPIGEVANWSADRFIQNKIVLEKVPSLKEVEEQDKNAPATYYRLPQALGRVGLISPITCKFCKDCNRIRLTADGILKYCLHSDDELNLRDIVRFHQIAHMDKLIRSYLLKKPYEHKIEEGKYVKRSMVRVGG